MSHGRPLRFLDDPSPDELALHASAALLILGDYKLGICVPEAITDSKVGFTQYRLILTAAPIDPLNQDTFTVESWQRYKNLWRVYQRLSLTHRQLYLRPSPFPDFPAPQLLGNKDQLVVEQRRKGAEKFLQAALDSEILRKSPQLWELFGEFSLDCPSSAKAVKIDSNQKDLLGSSSDLVSMETAAAAAKPANILKPEVVSGVSTSGGCSLPPDMELKLPDVPVDITQNESQLSPKSSEQEDILCDFDPCHIEPGQRTHSTDSNEKLLSESCGQKK